MIFLFLEFTVGLANGNNPSVWEVREPWKLLFVILEGIGKERKTFLILIKHQKEN